MNEMLHRDQYLQDRPTTQAAEGLPRYRWTVAEIDKLSEAGFFRKEDRFELIGGEIVPMQSKGARHERVKMDLNLHLARTLPPEVAFIPETTFRLSKDTYVEPDFTLFPRSVGIKGLNGETALLAQARKRGHRVVDGLGMLLHQAGYGFQKWFGVKTSLTPELRALVQADIIAKTPK